MTKTQRKAIIKCFELASNYDKAKNTKGYNNYKKQINFCSKLCKKERRKFYSSLDIKLITDNKTFWKILKSLLSDKGWSRINLAVNEENSFDNKKMAQTFNNYFDNAVMSLNLQYDFQHLHDVSHENDPNEIAIKDLKNHPSIQI